MLAAPNLEKPLNFRGPSYRFYAINCGLTLEIHFGATNFRLRHFEMPKLTPALTYSELDLAVLDKLAPVKRACVVLVEAIAVVNLAAYLIPGLGRFYSNAWPRMPAEATLAALLSALSFQFSEARQSAPKLRISLALAVALTLLTAAVLIEFQLQISLGLERLLPIDPRLSSAFPGRMSPQSAGAFLLVGCALILTNAKTRFAVHLADLLVFPLCMLVLVLVSGYIFGATHLSGISTATVTSPQTLVCLILLNLVVFLRRAELGVFSIFLGSGIGSRIARILSPIVLVLPFLRETARAHLIGSDRMPPHYATAILASVAAMLSLALLVYLAWRINSMEKEIQDLSLRDELTGLYNRRGFYLLAQQSLRMAHRSKLSFSVLFIDLDDLKLTNDSLGHHEGSRFLVETGELLKATFREIDVIGRIGGDEFAVAGQFSQAAMASAAQRMKESSELRNTETGRQIPLSFSLGFITSEAGQAESLDDLLAKADQAMYDEKRRKKVPVA